MKIKENFMTTSMHDFVADDDDNNDDYDDKHVWTKYVKLSRKTKIWIRFAILNLWENNSSIFFLLKHSFQIFYVTESFVNTDSVGTFYSTKKYNLISSIVF